MCNGLWLTNYDINKVKVISELLCIRHSYVNLECFNSEDIDFMIEFMWTDQAELIHCMCVYIFQFLCTFVRYLFS